MWEVERGHGGARVQTLLGDHGPAVKVVSNIKSLRQEWTESRERRVLQDPT